MSEPDRREIEAALLQACFVTGAVAEDYTVVVLFGEDGSVAEAEWIVEFSHLPDNRDRFITEMRASLAEVVGYGTGGRSTFRMVPRGTLQQWADEIGVASMPHLITDRIVAEELLRRVGLIDVVTVR